MSIHYTAPTLIRTFMQWGKHLPARHDLSSLRVLGSIAPLPGATALKPGSAQTPLPGDSVSVVDERGHPVGNGDSGYLVVDQPRPAMLRGIWGYNKRHWQTYWSRFGTQGHYFAGDGARHDERGDI